MCFWGRYYKKNKRTKSEFLPVFLELLGDETFAVVGVLGLIGCSSRMAFAGVFRGLERVGIGDWGLDTDSKLKTINVKKKSEEH